PQERTPHPRRLPQRQALTRHQRRRSCTWRVDPRNRSNDRTRSAARTEEARNATTLARKGHHRLHRQALDSPSQNLFLSLLNGPLVSDHFSFPDDKETAMATVTLYQPTVTKKGKKTKSKTWVMKWKQPNGKYT